jgi:type IV pilus assembly protein PilM
VQQFFENLEDQYDRLVISLKGYEGSIRILEFPFEDRRKISSVLPFELEQEYADGVDERIFRVEKIPVDTNPGMFPYLTIAVKKEIVDEYKEDFKGLRERPYLLEYDACANFNSFYRNKNEEMGDGLWVLLDIGARSTGINIMGKEGLLYTRSVFFGGNDFTRAIAETLNLSFEDAEDLKIEYGIKSANGGAENSKVDLALKNSLDYLVREIKLTLGAFHAFNGDMSLEHMYLFGGGATLSGLPEYFQSRLEIPVQSADPVKDLKVEQPPEKDPLLYSVAIGLALRGLEVGQIRHNFFERRNFLDTFIQKRWLYHSGAVFIASLCFLLYSVSEVGVVYWTQSSLKEKYDNYTRELLSQQKASYKDINSLHTRIVERNRLLERFAEAPKSPIHMIQYLSEKAASIDVMLEEITMENKETETEYHVKGTLQSAVYLKEIKKILRSYSSAVIRQDTVKSGADFKTGRYEFEELLVVRGQS